MPVRIRLQRRGRTHHAEYAIVVADVRAPRDGKYIEKLGTYNPNTNPATINLEFDRALYWVQQGAQPSDTARAILSHKGVLMYEHLLRGVKKEAFNEAEAEKRFEAWKNDKAAKIQAQKEEISSIDKKLKDEALKAEKEVNEKRAEALKAKFAEENAVEEEVTEETTEEVAETPEVKEEAKVEEKEEAKVEVKEEAKEETPKEKTEEK